MTTFNDIVYTIDLRNPSGTLLPPPSPFLSGKIVLTQGQLEINKALA